MALSASTVWEIRQDGDDTNGGGYVTGASGLDYSLQASPQLNVSDGATSNGTSTTLTSSTGGFTANMVGSIAHVYGGTNCSSGWYQITTYTDTNNVILDRTPSDGVGAMSGATIKVGGALASIGGLGAILAVHGVAAMCAYMKYSATDYALTTDSVNAAGGAFSINTGAMDNKAFRLIGYDSNRTLDNIDSNRPRIDCGEYAPTQLIKLGSTGSGGTIVTNIIGDANGGTVDVFVGDTAIYSVFINCSAIDADDGFNATRAIRCYAEGCVRGFTVSGCMCCRADSCSQYGFHYSGGDLNICTNSSSIGFYGDGQMYVNCVSYDNPTGFTCANSNRPDAYINCLSVNENTRAFSNSTGYAYNCASDESGSSGRGTLLIDIAPITLTEDPFIDAANGDFRLNTAAGGGELCRAAGLDPYGQNGALDVGAVQHADPASGGGLLTHPGMSGGMRG